MYNYRTKQGQFKRKQDYLKDQRFFRIAITYFLIASVISCFLN